MRKRRRPSFTARTVALVRSQLPRPQTPEGDPDAERRLCLSLRLPLALPLFAGKGRGNIAERTAFMDEETLQGINHGICQVVIVGAGYDGRALRFRARGVRFFEVDHPATQIDKRRRLEKLGVPLDNIRFVPINLLSEQLEDALVSTDYSRENASLFLCEGLIRYLPKACVDRLLASLHTLAAPGSKLILNNREHVAPIRLSRRRFFLSLIGEPIQSVFAIGETSRLLTATGWKISREARRAASRTERVLIAAVPTHF